jgi:hypothetical protein
VSQNSAVRAGSSQQTDRAWLVFIYRVPYDRAGPRVYVMRKLKDLGAVYLQQAVVILPDRPDLRRALDALSRRIEAYPGEAALLTAESLSRAWETQLIARFTAAVQVEYAGLEVQVAGLAGAVDRWQGQEAINSAHVETLEAEWRTVAARLEHVGRRDFFGAPGRGSVAHALTRVRAALDALRLRARVQELQAALGVDGGADVRGYSVALQRPKRMPRGTFQRLVVELRDAEEAYAALTAGGETPASSEHGRPPSPQDGIHALVRAIFAIPEDEALP